MPVVTTSVINAFVPATADNQIWVIAPGILITNNINVAFWTGAFDGIVLINHGGILSSATSGAPFGVFSPDESAHISINNESDGVITGYTGVWCSGDDVAVRNLGTITAFAEHGVQFGGAANHVSFDNSGYVYGLLSGLTVHSGSAQVVNVQNSGVIESGQYGMQFLNAAGALPVVVNTGIIRGGVASIFTVDGDGLLLDNRGTLIGDILLTTADQDDVIANAGNIIGDVHLGSGNDSFDGRGGTSGTVFGEDGNDTLIGGSLADGLDGGNGNDTLDGGAAADAMTGGAGDDTYFVDDPGDVVDETGGAGTDTVNASIDFSLADANHAKGDIENLILFGAALNGTGNGLANLLAGNANANTLDGAGGADTMTGLLGNDTYVVDDVGDIADETGGAGTDTIVAAFSFSLSDGAHAKGAMENLTLVGAAIAGTGNALANTIIGNEGANVLAGMDGDDVLVGGLGVDILLGGGDRDIFEFNALNESRGAGRDFIKLFNHAQRDQIDLATIDADTDGSPGNQAFKFIGSQEFTGLDGQLRFANGFVEGDTNGNGIADLRIKVTGPDALVAGDFLL